MMQAVNLHFDNVTRFNPQAILVFPCLDQHLLWVRHPLRGWEVPGGKIEPDESPRDAALREVWEESGATVSSLQWLAEYTVPYPDQPQRKWVYVATVRDVGARPNHSEITDVRLFRPTPSPDECRARVDFSWIMKDTVYQALWSNLQVHLTSR